jgi:deazaflavin-dependent oxidoreductase (nitroreductase family)
MPHEFDRWMYRGGRPNRLASVLNGMWKRVANAGLTPKRLTTLEVRGRRSGRVTSFPVVIADYEGGRYLVSMLGEKTNWVANVRAAGGEATLRHGGREPVRLEELAPAERAPIIKRYVEVAPGGRPHIPVEPAAPLSEFERIAADYPVFRIRTDRR